MTCNVKDWVQISKKCDVASGASFTVRNLIEFIGCEAVYIDVIARAFERRFLAEAENSKESERLAFGLTKKSAGEAKNSTKCEQERTPSADSF
jgi:hypothetical protein